MRRTLILVLALLLACSGVALGAAYSWTVNNADGSKVIVDCDLPTAVPAPANGTCNWTGIPAPTTTVPPTTTTTTPPASGCALPKYPGPNCTGVPAGTTLTTITGDLTISQANTVIDSKRITGKVTINAANVTIKNSQIDGYITNWANASSSYTIQDSTVGPASGCIIGVTIEGHDFTAIRVKTRGIDDAYRVTKPGHVTVRDSFAKLCGPQGSHSDGIQACCNGIVMGDYDRITLQHNTFDQRGAIDYTAPINLKDSLITSATVTDNMLAGGTYSLFGEWHSGPNWTIGGNKVVHNSWAFGPASMEGSCPHMTWLPGNATVNVDADYNITSTVTNATTCDPWN